MNKLGFLQKVLDFDFVGAAASRFITSRKVILTGILSSVKFSIL